MKYTYLQWIVFVALLTGLFGSAYGEMSRTVMVRAQVKGAVVSTGGNDYVKLTVNGVDETFDFTETYLDWDTDSLKFNFQVDLNEDYSVTVTQSGM